MRGILAACLLAIVANMALTLQAQPASACSCFIPSIRDGLIAEERDLLGRIADSSKVVMKAHVVQRLGSSTILEPLTIYRGERRAQYEVESPDCNGISAGFLPGEEWVVALTAGVDADYSAHGCSSHRANSPEGLAYVEYFEPSVESEEPLATPVDRDSEDEALSRALLITLSSAVGLVAASSISWVLLKRRGAQ